MLGVDEEGAAARQEELRDELLEVCVAAPRTGPPRLGNAEEETVGRIVTSILQVVYAGKSRVDLTWWRSTFCATLLFGAQTFARKRT